MSPTIVQAIEQRVSSTVAREVHHGQAVYVKQYVTGDWDRTTDVVRRRTDRECRLVETLNRSGLFDARLGVVRVVSAVPERAQLVTEEVPGSPMDVLLAGRFRRRSRECLQAMFLAGRWLSRLQRVDMETRGCKSISKLDPKDLVEYCELRLDRLFETGYRWPSRRVRQLILSHVKQLVRGSDKSDLEFVWCHGDYAPGNIIWDGRTLTPIDFAMAQAGRPMHDVSYFIHRLEMQRIYRPWKRWPIAVWKRAFLRGYGRPDAEASPMYRAMMVKHHICRLLTYVCRKPRNLKQRLHDKWVRARIRRRLRREASRTPS